MQVTAREPQYVTNHPFHRCRRAVRNGFALAHADDGQHDLLLYCART